MDKNIDYNFKNIQNDDQWNFFRENFTLDKNYIHLSLAIHVPHSNSLNKEIDKFRQMIDHNPDLMRRERHQYTNHTLDAAAKHLNTNKNLIALTDSSTMSLSLILNGLDFKNTDEILTTNSEHYSLEKLCEHNAERHNLKLTKINLKKCLEIKDWDGIKNIKTILAVHYLVFLVIDKENINPFILIKIIMMCLISSQIKVSINRIEATIMQGLKMEKMVSDHVIKKVKMTFSTNIIRISNKRNIFNVYKTIREGIKVKSIKINSGNNF